MNSRMATDNRLCYSNTSFNNFSNFMGDIEGDFDSLLQLDEEDKAMLKDAYDTISILNLWDWLKKPNVPGENGFMFSQHPEVSQITKAMKYGGHSGASFGMTMRAMESIAKNGWTEYANDVRATRYRICWTMSDGSKGYSNPVFETYALAKEFVKAEEEANRGLRYRPYYTIESIST